ncbi:MAG: LPS export ABC transporter periplasmic protein LptC [Armatimonadetes bacterium]|jgi:LPS export ABC transporter protein LptC|nr:LPS export ABC transporter periplasmic protein LptC [Armatimonadota bacterium]HOC31083.1 LPS export ABC transporter periplasmic protein LptC [Armatimonadota bacterium]
MRTRTARWLSWATACLVISAFGCGRRKPVQKPVEPPPPPVTGKSSGVRSVMDDAQGRRLWEVTAASSEQSQEKGTVVFHDARVTVYDKGKPSYRFIAPKAVALTQGKRFAISLTGGVSAKELAGLSAFTVDRMTWASDTRAFVGQGNARYTQGPLEMTGQRLSGAVPVRVINVTGDVHFTWKDDSSR